MTPISPPSTRPVLAFVRDYAAENGYPPLTSEIAAALGVSQGVVLRRLHLAASDGDLTYKPYSPRTWRLTVSGERKAGK